jgi:hypothetical protein
MVVFTPSFTRLLADSVYRGRLHDGVLRRIFFGVVGPKTAILDGQNIFFYFLALAKFKT